MKFRGILSLVLATAMWAGVPASAEAEIVSIDTIANVMTGSSSSGHDQVWVRSLSQLPGVPSSCVFNGSTLFYVSNEDFLSGDKAMAALLSAQISGKPVTLAYTVMGTSSDFWGFGITNCRIDRLSVGN